MTHAHLASLLYGRPLMVTSQQADVYARVLASRMAGEKLSVDEVPEALRTARAAFGDGSPVKPDRPYLLTASGVAVLPVFGGLIQRGFALESASGLTSYSRIGGMLSQAATDPEVKGILLEIDSPGGEVNGLFDLCDRIRAIADTKPVWSIANEQAYSAGYAILASATRVFAPKTAGGANIGTIMLHVDQSVLDAKIGLSYTYIHAGKRKADFNPHEPLSREAGADAQKSVDDLNAIFVAHVAKMRGVSEQSVYDLEARALLAADMQSAGLIDQIASFRETLALFEEHLSAKANPATTFTRASAPGAAAARVAPPTTQPPANQVANQSKGTTVSQTPETPDIAAQVAAARAEATAAERTRIGAILGHAKASANKAMTSMLIDKGFDAAQASALLDTQPDAAPAPAAAATPVNEFAKHMATIQNPQVQAGEARDPGQKTSLEKAEDAVAQARATGGKVTI